jgi:hypothetical protein
MEWLSRLLSGATAALVLVGLVGVQQPTPQPAPLRPVASILEPRSAVSVASTTVAPAPITARCPQWWELAAAAGWHADSMPQLDYVLWRESRCDPAAHNTTLNADGSADLGLAQVNDRSWCLPTRWYPDGYLQTIGVLPTVGCEQLFDPYTNLIAAKAIYDYAEETNGNGWQPWGL